MPLAYTNGVTDTPLLGETIGANLERTAQRFGDREALVSRHQGLRYTYAEFDAEVDRVARGLLALGLEKGERVGIWAPNCAEWALVQYATAKLGVVLVNINPAYRTSELRYALKQSGCRVLVAAESFKTSDYRAMVEEVRPDAAGLERVLFTGTDDWHQLLAGADGVGDDRLREREAELDFDDAINIQYTSGTTGLAEGRDAVAPQHPQQRLLRGRVLPLHGGGPGLHPGALLPLLRHGHGQPRLHHARRLHGHPRAGVRGPGGAGDRAGGALHEPLRRADDVHRRARAPGLRRLRPQLAAHGHHGRLALPAEVMRKVMDRMNMEGVTICYGMTETSPVSTQTTAEDEVEQRVSTVGRIHPHLEIKIVDPETGHTVERGDPGELCTRGYSVMLGYWEDEERTAEAIDPARWMHTGDLATMDEDGYMAIVGRSKDMVIRGGENVYPREVEEFLYGHDAVSDVSVVGVPDERFGEELAAFVIVREGESLEQDGLRDFCRDKIAHFKVPRYVIFVDEFPMTVTGKIQKYKLRATAMEELGLSDAEPELAAEAAR